MSPITFAALLVFLTIHEASSVNPRLNLRCQCIKKEKKPIGYHISTLKVNPANSHCMDIELIATLKNGLKVCLDPEAPWVKKVLQKKLLWQTLRRRSLHLKDFHRGNTDSNVTAKPPLFLYD
ncbi:C-X-C motif chemokine 2 [Austrofundulus limnaeus]|uniref:C-X-C motif chemokine 2 n=1 Tax=Austrofundulus limnaeus TaxID=52670 RepID=A0A2I4BLY0_AUSLI|nr:PREDICTED: C-X-C motif chemokine 2-like [Austrofundulus limnaeus]